jgi:hypothetical protein
VHAEHQVAQRGLAGAVFTQQAMDLAGADVEADLVQRGHCAEALAHAFEAQPGAGPRTGHVRYSGSERRRWSEGGMHGANLPAP